MKYVCEGYKMCWKGPGLRSRKTIMNYCTSLCKLQKPEMAMVGMERKRIQDHVDGLATHFHLLQTQFTPGVLLNSASFISPNAQFGMISICSPCA